MRTLRTEIDLELARRVLFDAFPKEGSSQQQFLYQELLAQEILHTEQELLDDKSRERKAHLHLVRIYGDALAWTYLSRYAIRQLARNSGEPPRLSSQKEHFDLAMNRSKAIVDQGVPALVADLTNILKVGDLIVCNDPDFPHLIECKLSEMKEASFEKQGRQRRQIARMESIAEYLRTGRGVIFGERQERRTVELSHTPEYNYPIVNEIVLAALHNPITLLVSEHELYAAAVVGEVTHSAREVDSWGVRIGERIVIGNSLDQITKTWLDVSPPILWNLTSTAQWALMDGQVSVTHAVKADSFLGIQNEHAAIRSVVDMKEHPYWGYEIAVGDDSLTVSANILLDVVYGHETIKSARERMLEFAEKSLAVIRGTV